MPDDSSLRDQLLELLHGGHAHATFENAVKDFPLELAGVRPPGAALFGLGAAGAHAHRPERHPGLQPVRRVRLAQVAGGILAEVARALQPAPVERIGGRAFRDRAAFEALLSDPANDLYRKFPWGDGQTLLREALLVADHNAYHLGQLVLVRRLLGAWPSA